jgi:hypothetical protein
MVKTKYTIYHLSTPWLEIPVWLTLETETDAWKQRISTGRSRLSLSIITGHSDSIVSMSVGMYSSSLEMLLAAHFQRTRTCADTEIAAETRPS